PWPCCNAAAPMNIDLHAFRFFEKEVQAQLSPLTPALSPLRGERGAADTDPDSQAHRRVVAQSLRASDDHRARAPFNTCGEALVTSPCPVTSHLGNSQVIGNQGRHPFVVQAGQKSSREVTGRNARTKSGGFSPLNGERAGERGENAKEVRTVSECSPPTRVT